MAAGSSALRAVEARARDEGRRDIIRRLSALSAANRDLHPRTRDARIRQGLDRIVGEYVVDGTDADMDEEVGYCATECGDAVSVGIGGPVDDPMGVRLVAYDVAEDSYSAAYMSPQDAQDTAEALLMSAARAHARYVPAPAEPEAEA